MTGEGLSSASDQENALISMDCRVKPGNDETGTTMDAANAT